MAAPKNVVELLQDLVAIPSVNPQGHPGTDETGEQALGEYVADFLRALGTEVTLDPVEPGRPNVVASFTPKDPVAHLAFAPHLDTVSVAGMTIPPFDPVLRDGKLFGRGSSDTKGPMAAALWAVREWAQSAARTKSRIRWSFLALMGEEAGNDGAHALTKKGFSSDLTLVLEPTQLGVVTAHKGALWLEIDTTGVACHGATPERGRNAIYAMRRVLEIIEEKIIPDLSRYTHAKLGSPTLNVGTISGGSKINIVPDQCRVEVDCRIVPGMDTETFRREIELLLRTVAPDIAVRLQRYSPPLDTDESLPWVRRLGEQARGFTTAPWFSDASVLSGPKSPPFASGRGPSPKRIRRTSSFSCATWRTEKCFSAAGCRPPKIPRMNADTAKDPGLFRRAPLIYQNATGQSLVLWTLVALLNFIVQIVFRRELAPGEFGTLNTALGMIGLMTVPLLAVNLAFTHYLAHHDAAGPNARIDSLRDAAFLATETFAWIWGGLCFLLVFLLLPLLDLPRFSLQLFTLMNVLIALGGLVSWAVCQSGNQRRLWAWLLAASALARVVAGACLTSQQPWAESGLAAFVFAGFITLAPALRTRETDAATRWKACVTVWNRDFLLYAGATFSVLLAAFLFTSADRIVAQSWFGVATNNNLGLVNWDLFDAYQTAGLLGRSLLWGTQPLLWILFAQRSRLDHTKPASLTFFWIYLGALLLGTILLGCLAQPLSRLFCGPNFQSTSLFVPTFAAVMVPLGLLQGLGIFSLASRRYHECFVLGGCGVGYTLLLYLAGRQPQLMPAYMFGGGLVSLMVVLFVGVVRWGRKQP